MIRPGSEERPDIQALRERGVQTQVMDLRAPPEEVAKCLAGQEVVIPAISIPATSEQIPLATAAKLAGVKRFLPCFYAPVAPPKGAVALRDTVSRKRSTTSIDGIRTLTALAERGRSQPREEPCYTIHHHRHWLVVPTHATHLVLRCWVRRIARYHPR